MSITIQLYDGIIENSYADYKYQSYNSTLLISSSSEREQIIVEFQDDGSVHTDGVMHIQDGIPCKYGIFSTISYFENKETLFNWLLTLA